MIYTFLSNNPSAGDINPSNCLVCSCLCVILSKLSVPRGHLLKGLALLCVMFSYVFVTFQHDV